MTAIALTGTSYILTTDDLLSGWDQKSWIEAADDRQSPDTTVSSFDELLAAAATGGAGSPAMIVKDAIMAVLSATARSSEQWLEAFAIGIYSLPLNPADGIAKDLILAWMRHLLKVRHDLYRNPESQIGEERALTTRATYIRDEITRLSASRPDVSLTSSIAAYGGDFRRDPSALGPFHGPIYYPNRRW